MNEQEQLRKGRGLEQPTNKARLLTSLRSRWDLRVLPGGGAKWPVAESTLNAL